jgi:hypothetical protein
MTTINFIIITSFFGVLGNIAGRLRAFFFILKAISLTLTLTLIMLVNEP